VSGRPAGGDGTQQSRQDRPHELVPEKAGEESDARLATELRNLAYHRALARQLRRPIADDALHLVCTSLPPRQAILGTYPKAPETMLRSMEADIYPPAVGWEKRLVAVQVGPRVASTRTPVAYCAVRSAADQAPSVAWAVSAVAVQLARRFSASSDFEPGSAVNANIVKPESAESSIVSKVRVRSPTTG
jgi:hypothetical protein